MRWRQVDLEGAQLLIDHQLIDNGYTSVSSGEPKSHRGRRVIALDPATVLLLTRHRDAQRSLRRAAGLVGNPTFVFCREDGSHYHPEFVTRHFQVLVRRADLPRLRLHDLRHTHATLGLAAGVPAKIMADRLGHSSVLLTLDTYSHVSPALDARAAGLIAGLIAGEGEVIDNPMYTCRPLAPGPLSERTTPMTNLQVRTGGPSGDRTPNPRIKRTCVPRPVLSG